MDSVVTGVTGAALVTAFATSAAQGSSGTVTGLLAVAAALSVLHSIAAGRAATMFKIGKAAGTQAVLGPSLARFARWAAARAALQAATLVTVAIAAGIGVAA